MTTFEERIQNIADFFGEDDNDVLKERVRVMFYDTRARVIRQSYSSSGIIDEEYQQAIVMKMEEVPSTLNAPYYRTIAFVPDPIRLKNMVSFTYVGDKDMNYAYGFKPINAFRYQQYNRYNKASACYAYHDDRVYTINARPRQILIKGAFYYFQEVNKLSDRVHDDSAVDIATPGDIVDLITDMIIQKLSQRTDKNYEQVTVDDPQRNLQQ